MSNIKFAGRVTWFVFTLFGFTILFDALTNAEAQIASPGVGILFLIIGGVAYQIARHR